MAFSATAGADIKVTLLSQDPDPVEPGQIVTVKFKIENDGEETREDVIIKLHPVFPFSIYRDSAEKNVGKLQGASTGADAAVVEFQLKVDEAAVEKETELPVEIIRGNGGFLFDDDQFLIDVQTNDPILELTSITTTPENIVPGSPGTLQISVKNLADSLLKDIKFNLDFDAVPLLAPYQSSSQKRIAHLQSEHQLPLSFGIIADPAATPGLYKIPLNITYSDEQGDSFTLDEIIAILVGDEPDVKTYIKKSTVLAADSAGVVTIEIANTGTNDVKFLELTLLPSDQYELISTSNYVYIGDVDSDDTESEEFNIFINDDVETLQIPLSLEYTDANNNPLQQQMQLELQLYSSSQLRAFGVIESGNGAVWVILILLIGGGWYWKKRKKKKKGA